MASKDTGDGDRVISATVSAELFELIRMQPRGAASKSDTVGRKAIKEFLKYSYSPDALIGYSRSLKKEWFDSEKRNFQISVSRSDYEKILNYCRHGVNISDVIRVALADYIGLQRAKGNLKHHSIKTDPMIKAAVIFDMDGVILDTESAYKRAWIELSDERYGLDGIGDIYGACIGRAEKDIMSILSDRYGSNVDWIGFFADVNKRVGDMFEKTGFPLKNGAEEILLYLRNMHIPIAIASSTYSAQAQRELKSAGVLHFFDKRIFGDEVNCSKPDPEIFLKAAAKLNTSPDKCFVIEDSVNGIRAAKAAGMIPIMVPDLLPPDTEMEESAEAILPSLVDVINYLDKKLK